MSLPIPRCAWCGHSLDMRYVDIERGGCILHQYRGIPGTPAVGWCGGSTGGRRCHDADPLVAELLETRGDAETNRTRSTESILREIDARGAERLSAGSAARVWRARLTSLTQEEGPDR